MSPMSPRLLRPRARQAGALPPSGTPASFLLRFDGNFNDSSVNALATSATGATLSSTTKKWGSGSAYFATAGQQWVEFSNDPPLLGSQDFTMECWLYLEEIGPGGASHLMGRHQACTGAAPLMAIQNSTGVLYWEGGATLYGGNPVPTGQWTHLAVVRSGETLSGYMNGMLEASVSLTGSLNDFEYPFRIGGTDGCNGQGSGIQGYIDDARLVVGLAVYTTNFTPPAAPLTVYATPYVPQPPLSPSTSGWSGTGSEAAKLARATLTNITGPNTVTINSAGLLRITATTSGAGDGTGGLMTIVAGGQTYTGNSGGTGGSWTIDITKTVTVGQTITFASEYANGSFNSLQAWIIPPAAPPAPTSLTSPSQSSGSVYLTWAAPANDGGSAITDYAVQYSSNSGSTWTTFSRSASTALNATVNSLTNGTAYQFRVAGVNSVGTGTFSATATATPSAGASLTATGYSGSGTAASKLAPPASPATFTSSPSITVNVSGTLNVSIVSDDNYNDAWEVIIRRNGTTVYSNDGNAANGTTFTVAVTSGQTITLAVSGGGARWFAGTRLWVS